MHHKGWIVGSTGRIADCFARAAALCIVSLDCEVSGDPGYEESPVPGLLIRVAESPWQWIGDRVWRSRMWFGLVGGLGVHVRASLKDGGFPNRRSPGGCRGHATNGPFLQDRF